MKKTLLLTFLFVFVLLLPSIVTAGVASVYKITITKMELHNGSSWVEVFSGTSAEIDIASVSAGSSIGNILSGLTIPDGTYTQVRTTASANITLSGTDGGFYTTATTNTVGDDTGCVATGNVLLEAECAAVVGTTPQNTTTFSAPITALNNNLSHKIRVNFDVSAALTYNGGAGTLFLDAPSVIVTAIPIE